jgi:beta-lactamase superfamily II metal-dependent hydrolase
MTSTTTPSFGKRPIPTTVIHFKNVDQGDSIIVEWIEAGVLHVGIIDCAINGNKENPIVLHLKSIDVPYQLHFIVLTHPHKDHYTGVLELLDYLETAKIKTTFFCHTYYYHLKLRDKLPLEKVTFLTQFKTVATRMESAGLFDESIQIGSRTIIPLSASGLQLRCLSPSNQELGWYQDKVGAAADKGEMMSSAEANLLSTILKIESEQSYTLFTSDADVRSFERLYKIVAVSENSQKMVMGQVPHHGSAKNYHDKFWHRLVREAGTSAVVSVGANDYGHPSGSVLQSLDSAGYQVHCTNIVNDAVVYYNKVAPQVQPLLIALDDVSIVVNEKRHLSFEMPF